jgi:hypothetical protein
MISLIKGKYRQFILIIVISCIVLKQWIYSFYVTLTNSFFAFPEYGSDVTHNLARARMVWLGNPPQQVAGDGLSDGMSSSLEYILYFLPTKVMHFFGTKDMFAYFTFLLVFVTIAVNIGLIFSLSSKFIHSSKFQILSVLGYLYGSDLLNVLNTNSTGSLLAARWPSSVFNSIFVLVFLNSLFSAASKIQFFIKLITLIFSLHTYFYSWQILFTILFVSIILTYATKDYQNFKHLSILFLIALPFLIHKIYLIYESHFSPRSSFYELIVGLSRTNQLSVTKLLIYLLLLLIISILLKKSFSKTTKKLVATIFLTSVILLNQQFITGFQVQPGHYHWYFIFPFTNFLSIIMFSQLLDLFKHKNFLNYILNGVNLMLCLTLLWMNSGTVYHTPNYYFSKNGILPERNQRFIAFPDTLEIFFIFNSDKTPSYTWHSINYPSVDSQYKVLLHSLLTKRIFSDSQNATAIRSTSSAHSHLEKVRNHSPIIYKELYDISNNELVELVFVAFNLDKIYIDSLENEISCESLEIKRKCSGDIFLTIQ